MCVAVCGGGEAAKEGVPRAQIREEDETYTFGTTIKKKYKISSWEDMLARWETLWWRAKGTVFQCGSNSILREELKNI